jgi:hypothetical protein
MLVMVIFVWFSCAGSQVFANEADYWDYWSIIEKASSIWGNTFSYTLFTQDQIKL